MPSGPAVVAVSLKRRTQDAWGVLRADEDDARAVRAAWVIDGATPLGAADPRAADDRVSRFAWALSAGLRRALADDAELARLRRSRSATPGSTAPTSA